MSEIIPGKVYKHHKGDRYLVLHIVDESTNTLVGNQGVVYVSLTYGKIKHRDLKEFTEEVLWPDGQIRPRFTLEDN